MTNSNDKPNVAIIGAGISGLVAAIQLEKRGYAPVLFEADTKVGGRVQTDVVNGFQLDRGFQVLLEAYPQAKKYLDYDALELEKLQDGARLFSKGKSTRFGNPRRDLRFLLSTLTTSQATLADKWKIFSLNNELRNTELDHLFGRPTQTTLAYLQSRGFSKSVIRSFFRPFFSGIFLEPNLDTPSRMFEFVFKMFGEGSAVIPKQGIGAIPMQLKNQLKETTFHLNTKVRQVIGSDIILENDNMHTADFTIVATSPESIIPNYVSSQKWRSCDTLYFTTNQRSFEEPIIGLNTATESLVNNIFYPTSIQTGRKGSCELLSVTIVKDHGLTDSELMRQVAQELSIHFGIADVTFLKHYKIPNALPQLEDLQCGRDPGEQLLTEHIALAGDYLLNGSLNAAMESGEKAAEVAHGALQTRFISA